MIRDFLFFVSLGLCSLSHMVAQTQATSASQHAQCKSDDHAVATVEYDSMQRTGHMVFGGIVPYGQVWSTGDKHSPTLVADRNLIVGGKEVPIGHYSVTTIPDREKWTLIVKGLGDGKGLKSTDEVARIDLLVRRLPTPLKSFTISFDQVGGGCVLNLRWEQTEASVVLAEKK